MKHCSYAWVLLIHIRKKIIDISGFGRDPGYYISLCESVFILSLRKRAQKNYSWALDAECGDEELDESALVLSARSCHCERSEAISHTSGIAIPPPAGLTLLTMTERAPA